MTSPVPQAVIFDLGGVAFHYRPDERWENFATLTGETPEEIRKRLMNSGYSEACDQGRLAGEAAYKEGIRLLGQRLTLDHFRALWVSAFTPRVEVIELARNLKQATTVALLTNNSDLVRQGLTQQHPFAMETFRPQLFSSDVGYLKPDPRIFDAMLNLLDLAPADALLVDDAPQHIASADSLGMATHRFQNVDDLRDTLQVLGLPS